MKIAIGNSENFTIADEEKLPKLRVIRDGRHVKVGNITYPLYRGLNFESCSVINTAIKENGSYAIGKHEAV